MSFFPPAPNDGDEIGPNTNGTYFKYVAADNKWIIISNVDVYSEAEVDAFKLNKWVAPDGDVSMGTQKIINVVDPVADQDASTKKYHNDNKTVAGDLNLNDLAEKDHVSLANRSEDDHHNKQHLMDDITQHTRGDNAVLDASTSFHGFLKKLDNQAANFMNGQGNWAVPQGAAGFAPPIGFIGMYSGTWVDNSTIPGWYKCDGNNGTVNLVDKFVRGATTSGGSGGSDDAVVVSHTHDIATIISGSGYSHLQKLTGTLSIVYVTTEGEGVSGTGKNIPAYYALIFIQRVS